ncbi:MAG: dihydroorotase [Candidatus Gastranaerophilales bacterium]|nr:dihydroorotase [Candidatus Gastranaerophilales bacterium]
MKLPSFIDMHVHLREPGFTEKETIESGLMAAYKGGFGAIIAMPNTNPVCDTPEIARFIRRKGDIELYPAGAVTRGLKSEEIVDFKLMKEAGCIAFSNDGFSTKKVKEALESGELILSHLENETEEAIEQIQILSKIKNGRLHFCHVSKKSTVDVIRKAKNKGIKLTAETCPHYFIFTENDRDLTGRFKMNPPLGSEDDRQAVIEGVKDGTIDVISTDHAPHTNKEKLLPYEISPNGITGLETAFSLTYMTFGLDLTLEKMAFAPRRILNINPKREIEVDLNGIWTVEGIKFKSKCKITPYEGRKLKGIIIC